MRTYVRTRAWSDADLDAAEARLRDRGVLDGDGLSAAGLATREAIEAATDAAVAPSLDALGDDVDELLGILEPWGADDPRGRRLSPVGPARTRVRAAERLRPGSGTSAYGG